MLHDACMGKCSTSKAHAILSGHRATLVPITRVIGGRTPPPACACYSDFAALASGTPGQGVVRLILLGLSSCRMQRGAQPRFNRPTLTAVQPDLIMSFASLRHAPAPRLCDTCLRVHFAAFTDPLSNNVHSARLVDWRARDSTAVFVADRCPGRWRKAFPEAQSLCGAPSCTIGFRTLSVACAGSVVRTGRTYTSFAAAFLISSSRFLSPKSSRSSATSSSRRQLS
jgi:hypothetical protein